MIDVMFVPIFLFQFVFWLFLNLTRIGQAILAIWGSLTLMGFIVNVFYPAYLQTIHLGTSGNFLMATDLIVEFVKDSVLFLVNLVIPPWLGLLVGLFSTHAQRGEKYDLVC
ncbi:conserved hypothetical protein [Ferroglobus placidus DSM 10642]|uniref:Uncharacterized protein n=1 Tax=Ferroglobus placidus (strain DSM 10642 / AEDII12DO) TaxID=589924 RepID=D3S0S9_FERPA|nr:hypothetical protein [Ferroglobus placidus]ADC66320.1 conserved hypothetical protein [Ferroglobus placidus DSM 10642]